MKLKVAQNELYSLYFIPRFFRKKINSVNDLALQKQPKQSVEKYKSLNKKSRL